MSWRIKIIDTRDNTARLSLSEFKHEANALEHIKVLQTLSESKNKKVSQRYKHVKFYEYQAVKIGGRK